MSKPEEHKTSIGGQAVMEGVMMKSATSLAMSVRRSDGTIVVEKQKLSQKPWRKVINKIPVVRGVVAFVDSLISGMNLTSHSAELFGEDLLEGEEPTKFEKWLSKTFNIKLEGENFEIGINSHYLLDVLKAIEDENIQILFNGPGAGFLIVPVDNDNFKYMIMPMRLK